MENLIKDEIKQLKDDMFENQQKLLQKLKKQSKSNEEIERDQAETMQEKADLISCEYREQQKCLMDILGISQEKRNFETLKEAIENLKIGKEKVNQEQPASSSRSQSRTRSRCQSRIRSRSRSRTRSRSLSSSSSRSSVRSSSSSSSELVVPIKKELVVPDSAELMKLLNKRIAKDKRDYESLKEVTENLKKEKEKQTKDNSELKEEIGKVKDEKKKAIDNLKSEKEIFNAGQNDLMEILKIPPQKRDYESLEKAIENLVKEKEKQTKDNSKLKKENDELNNKIGEIRSNLMHEKEKHNQSKELLEKLMKSLNIPPERNNSYEPLIEAIEDLKREKEKQTKDNSK